MILKRPIRAGLWALGATTLLSLTFASAGRTAADLCVGGPHCFATVQAALDAAAGGDVIRIAPGTYAGGITITKDVSLVGADAHAVRISGGGPVVTVGSKTT